MPTMITAKKNGHHASNEPITTSAEKINPNDNCTKKYTVTDYRNYILSLCRVRRKLIISGKSNKNDYRCNEIIRKLEAWIFAYPNASLKGYASFFMKNGTDILYLIASNTTYNKNLNTFAELYSQSMDEQKAGFKLTMRDGLSGEGFTSVA